MNDPIRSFVNAYDEALSNCKTSYEQFSVSMIFSFIIVIGFLISLWFVGNIVIPLTIVISSWEYRWVLTIIPIAFCLLILFKELTYGSKQKLKAME